MFQSSLQSRRTPMKTKLLVNGRASLEDLMMLFSTFGEVSSIVWSVTGGAKVTFKETQPLTKFHTHGKLVVGGNTLLVTKITEEEPENQTSLGLSITPSPQANRSFAKLPPPLSSLYQYPKISSLGFRPQQPPAVFTFQNIDLFPGTPTSPNPGRQVSLQPLTPISPSGPPNYPIPGYPFMGPPPPLLVEPPSLSLCETSLFQSPFKKFVKFEGIPTKAQFPLRQDTRHQPSSRDGARFGGPSTFQQVRVRANSSHVLTYSLFTGSRILLGFEQQSDQVAFPVSEEVEIRRRLRLYSF